MKGAASASATDWRSHIFQSWIIAASLKLQVELNRANPEIDAYANANAER